MNEQIHRETGKALPPAVLDDAFSRLQITYNRLHAALNSAARQASDAGFLGRQMPDLSNLYDLSLLNLVLAEKTKGDSMSTQSVQHQFPIPLDTPARAKRSPVAVERPHPAASLGIPKGGLRDVCLNYRTPSGEQLLALILEQIHRGGL